MFADYYSIKGFVSYGNLTNNQLNAVSPVGELSLRSSTFAKDRQHFYTTTNTVPSSTVEVTVFSCKNTAGVSQQVEGVLADLMRDIGRWSYLHAINGDFDGISDTYRTQFLAAYAASVESATVGMMSTDGTIWLPTYVTFFVRPEVVYDDGLPEDAEQFRIRLWFSDTAFKQQYDEYDLAFIPPVEDLDSLFGSPYQVAEQLGLRTPPELTQLIQEASDNKPYTVVRSMNFKYHYKNNPQQTANAYWTFVIWSDYGDNVDTLKRDLAEWILDNSTHTREEWSEIFPDIFTSTEVIITPLWNQIAVPNLTLDYAMYSPTILMEEAALLVQGTAAGTGYTEPHVAANASFLSMPYKSIACLAVGGPENRDDKFRLFDFVPDYLAVPPSSIDFDRMSESTRFWAMKIYSMMATAETMGEFTDVPAGMSRLKRTNASGKEILYLVSTINDVQYLVVSRFSLNKHWPPVDRTTAPIVFSPDPSVTLTTPMGSKRLQLNVSVTGGTTPYVYSATSADIEAGGEIDPTTGYLDVTFREDGTNRIDVTVVDARGFPATANYTVVVNSGT